MIITLDLGLVKGGEDQSLITGSKFHVFYGIMYAEPPLGDLRFTVSYLMMQNRNMLFSSDLIYECNS